MDFLPNVNDLILLEFGNRDEEFRVRKVIGSRVQLALVDRWMTLKELNERKAEVIGKYTKVFGPFGYKTYYGESE